MFLMGMVAGIVLCLVFAAAVVKWGPDTDNEGELSDYGKEVLRARMNAADLYFKGEKVSRDFAEVYDENGVLQALFSGEPNHPVDEVRFYTHAGEEVVRMPLSGARALGFDGTYAISGNPL